MEWDAFFRVHEGLPREGPGLPADVEWAARIARTPADASVLDAACGPGADISALLHAAPHGRVLAVEQHPPFVEQGRARHEADARVTIEHGDMADVIGPFDLIWCAGAIYFLGVTEALRRWRPTLSPGGAVAFSTSCWFTDSPSEPTRSFWAAEGEAGMTDAAGIARQVAAAGFETVDTRVLTPAAWEAYHGPIEERLDDVRDDPSMAEVVAATEQEIAVCRDFADEAGYLLSVVRPLD